MKRFLLYCAIVGFIMLAGCCAIAENASKEMGTCINDCVAMCRTINTSIETHGYATSIRLSKQTGGLTTSCTCSCSLAETTSSEK